MFRKKTLNKKKFKHIILIITTIYIQYYTRNGDTLQMEDVGWF